MLARAGRLGLSKKNGDCRYNCCIWIVSPLNEHERAKSYCRRLHKAFFTLLMSLHIINIALAVFPDLILGISYIGLDSRFFTFTVFYTHTHLSKLIYSCAWDTEIQRNTQTRSTLLLHERNTIGKRTLFNYFHSGMKKNYTHYPIQPKKLANCCQSYASNLKLLFYIYEYEYSWIWFLFLGRRMSSKTLIRARGKLLLNWLAWERLKSDGNFSIK